MWFFVFSINFARTREGRPARRKLTELLVKSKKTLVTDPAAIFFVFQVNISCKTTSIILYFKYASFSVVTRKKRQSTNPHPDGNFFDHRFGLGILRDVGMMFAQPDKQKLFKPATLREMMTPKDITPDGFTVWGSPFEMVFKEHVLVRAKGGNIDTYSATFSVIPELALGANILISTIFYLQADASKGSTLLYNLLVPMLNETLFEVQRHSHFPIEPAPYVGKFELTRTNPIYGTNVTSNVTIRNIENILRFEYPPLGAKAWVEMRYIGESLVFQARYRTPGMSCLVERIGTFAAVYFDALGKDKLSPGFRVPEWLIVAKRVKETNESSVDESEENMEGFAFNPFKSAI